MVNSWLPLLFLWLFTYPFTSLCQQGEGKQCNANLSCDRKAGLHCSPKPNGICQECGVNNRQNHFDKRIVGGKPADPKSWPWMAGITKKVSKDFPFCGGTLITDRHVLTAAHCIIHFAPTDLMVRLGEYDFSKVGDNSPMDFDVEKIVIHEKYNPSNTDNDIVVLTLRTEVKFNEFIWPVCLPSPNMKIENEIGLVAGWGTKFFEGPTNSVLHEAAVKVWKRSDCIQAYTDSEVTNNMMCCGWASGKVDSCHGDSGGPLTMKIRGSKKWFLVGIVSWGRGCASANRPGVYAIVSNYLDWIETQTKYLNEQKKTKSCPTGWISSPSTCFHIGNEELNYDASVSYCAGKGGSLAVITNAADMTFARDLLNQNYVRISWIGLRRDKNGAFKWIDGTSLQYQSWTENQPDNYLGNESCVAMDRYYKYLWNDDGCHKPMTPFCSRSASV